MKDCGICKLPACNACVVKVKSRSLGLDRELVCKQCKKDLQDEVKERTERFKEDTSRTASGVKILTLHYFSQQYLKIPLAPDMNLDQIRSYFLRKVHISPQELEHWEFRNNDVVYEDYETPIESLDIGSALTIRQRFSKITGLTEGSTQCLFCRRFKRDSPAIVYCPSCEGQYCEECLRLHTAVRFHSRSCAAR
jgi:hypothetical protein